MKFITQVCSKYSVTSSDFKDDPEKDFDFKELNEALKFMKDSGLIPKGIGKPTKPSTSAEHEVAWDKDLFLCCSIGKDLKVQRIHSSC